MQYNVVASLEAGQPYTFRFKDGTTKRITVWGDGDGFIDVEVDGVRSNHSSLGNAIGDSCVGFTAIDA